MTTEVENATPKKIAETPLMKQYNKIKAKYPDALLLFRVGDFYEMFGEDAIKAAKILGIVLTKRKNGAAAYIELAGFPHHSIDAYLPKLVRAGYRVAICDQLEDPKATKTIVKRGVTELVTPGVSFNDHVLEGNTNNFLAAVSLNKKTAGVAFLDISTGEFLVAEGSYAYVEKLVQGFRPSEILYQKFKDEKFQEAFGDKHHVFRLNDWVFTKDFAHESLTQHFGTNSLKGFGIDLMDDAVIAAGAVLYYLNETKHNKVAHIQKIARIHEDQYVWLDKFTIRNLELVYTANEGARTLISILDHTLTPMGGRTMKRWMVLPLKNQEEINNRLDVVTHFVRNQERSHGMQMHLRQIGDLERLISKVAAGRISPREVKELHRTLVAIIPLQADCLSADVKALKFIGEKLDHCQSICERMARELHDDPPALLHKGGVIANGVDAELDEWRKMAYSGKDYLMEIQQRETERTGIPSLKISYNNVFGYFLEVRNAHKDKVPTEWIRKQTLTQAERYITEELKEYEGKILSAEVKIQEIETRLFNELIFALSDYISPIQQNAQLIGRLDCMLSFAAVAAKQNYARPVVHEGLDLKITEGRHPVIEQQLPFGESYVPNDILLNKEEQQIIMITGPNMSGKSALLRQTALIVLMAQMGSYVPAASAEIGMVDKIFTRVGASDNISSGESTFMVEMNETASIMNNLSERSLILLDEIGRGTSTYDGISIAWAIAEYIHQHPSKAKTLFATHYHELNDMTQNFRGIKNYNVSVEEVGKKVIFLRKLAPGGSNHSFGIHVARMAGMPASAVKRAEEVLAKLEQSHLDDLPKKNQKTKVDEMQLSFFQLDDPVLIQIKEKIEQTDIDNLTPVDALMKLHEIKRMIGG